MPVSTARPAFLRIRLITGTGGTVSRELEVMINRLASVIESDPIFSSSFRGGSTFPGITLKRPERGRVGSYNGPASHLLSKTRFRKFAPSVRPFLVTGGNF